jgi:signal transduction histidine kinase
MPIIEDAGLTITVGPIDPVPPMTIDARRIDEVLANLLTNAIRYVPSGGHVRVSLSRQAEGVLLEVVDNGPGIPPKDQARLFQRLSQLDAGRREGMGLGLGLWICKSIIEALGGTIGVESRPGEGATFWFTLPGPA